MTRLSKPADHTRERDRSERSLLADAYRQLDRLTIHYIGMSAVALVAGIIAVAVIAGKGVDSLSTLAAGALGYLGGRFNNRRQDPPGTITATPPAEITTARSSRRSE